jgi:hypothetical protein
MEGTVIFLGFFCPLAQSTSQRLMVLNIRRQYHSALWAEERKNGVSQVTTEFSSEFILGTVDELFQRLPSLNVFSPR